MRIKVDEVSDALHFRLDESPDENPDESPVVESEEIQPGVILDYDADGQAVEVRASLVVTGFRLSSEWLRDGDRVR